MLRRLGGPTNSARAFTAKAEAFHLWMSRAESKRKFCHEDGTYNFTSGSYGLLVQQVLGRDAVGAPTFSGARAPDADIRARIVASLIFDVATIKFNEAVHGSSGAECWYPFLAIGGAADSLRQMCAQADSNPAFPSARVVEGLALQIGLQSKDFIMYAAKGKANWSSLAKRYGQAMDSITSEAKLISSAASKGNK